MIYQFTGQPGHGKSLHALDLALEFKDKGRVVYACNIRKLDHEKSGLLPLTPEQFKDWPAFLPDGAVVLVDECYEHEMLPKRGPGVKVPHWVEQLAKHRHRGLDFIFVCQSPGKQMDSFVHDLIERHTHVRRRFGLNFVHLRVFDRYEARPEKAQPLILKRVRLPKRPMGMYESTELDTTERKIPWYYPVAAGLVLAIIGGVAWTWVRIDETFDADRMREQAKATPGGNGALATVPPGGVFGADRSLGSPREYAELHLPRFATMPWTAPVFDERGATADPQLLCMSSMPGQDVDGDHREGSCTCLTEQGTRYDIGEAQCRTVARYGTPYNPYRQTKPANRAEGPQGALAASDPFSPGSVITGDQVTGYGDMGQRKITRAGVSAW